MSKHVLWLDNDYQYLLPYKNTLAGKDYEVELVTTVREAEELLSLDKHKYDLIILDVMIPAQDKEEEIQYPSSETDRGHQTGLVFFRRMKDKFGDALPPVLVMTVRLDQDIQDEFLKAGLSQEHFSTKFQLRDAGRFLNKVESILRKKSE